MLLVHNFSVTMLFAVGTGLELDGVVARLGSHPSGASPHLQSQKGSICGVSRLVGKVLPLAVLAGLSTLSGLEAS